MVVSKGFALVPVIVLLAVGLVFTLVFVIPKNKNGSGSVPEDVGSAEFESSPAAFEPSSDRNSYENVEFYLRFYYPPESMTEELYNLGPNYFQINLLDKQTQKALGIFMIRTSYEEEEVENFVGIKFLDVINIGGQTWYYFNFPEGYSNSPPFTVYQNEKSSFLYSFKFYNLVSDELRDQIMATVKILPPL